MYQSNEHRNRGDSKGKANIFIYNLVSSRPTDPTFYPPTLRDFFYLIGKCQNFLGEMEVAVFQVNDRVNYPYWQKNDSKLI